MRSIALALSLAFFALPAQAAELVLFERDGCYYCLEWKKSVGKYYHKTKEGIAAPLTQVNVQDGMPARLAGIKKPVITPTFVLIDNGREIGRLRGYPGEKPFWTIMGKLMERGNIAAK